MGEIRRLDPVAQLAPAEDAADAGGAEAPAAPSPGEEAQSDDAAGESADAADPAAEADAPLEGDAGAEDAAANAYKDINFGFISQKKID